MVRKIAVMVIAVLGICNIPQSRGSEHPFLPEPDPAVRTPQNQSLPEFIKRNVQLVATSYVSKCKSYSGKGWSVYEFTTPGLFPNGCDVIRLCNQTKCVEFGMESMLFATVTRQSNNSNTTQFFTCSQSNSNHDTGILSDSDIPCQIKDVKLRHKRAALRHSWNRTTSGFSFTLPGTRYCGSGTNVAEMDKQGGPLNTLDAICRAHDLDYAEATSETMIWAADDKLIQRVKLTDPYVGIVFSTFFKAKRLYEKMFGSPYVTSVDYCIQTPDNLSDGEPILARYMSPVQQGGDYVQYEKVWSEMVDLLWVQECAKSTQVPSKSACSLTDTSITAGTTSMPATATPTTYPTQDGSEPECVPRKAERKMPKEYGRCKIVISELKAGFVKLDLLYWVELMKICPAKVVNNAQTLVGVFLVIVSLEDGKVFSLADFSDKSFRATNEECRSNGYAGVFLIGAAGQETVVDANAIIPGYGDKPYIILMSYIRQGATRNALLNRIKTAQVQNVPPLEKDIVQLVASEMDVLLYGRKCNSACQALASRFLSPLTICDNIYPNMDTIPFNIGDADASLSRCPVTANVMVDSYFVLASPTPGDKNACPSSHTPRSGFPFKFQGHPIQSDGQKLIANLQYFYDLKGTPNYMIENSVVSAVARSLNLCEKYVRRVLAKLNKDVTFSTPGKQRKRRCPVRDRIESFETDALRRIIVGFYKQNQAPMFENIYQKYLEFFPTFKCSRCTFRKILRAAGYRYKKIQNRAVLVQRPDIVVRRGLYLKALRENDAKGENKSMVIYLDETWIDPNARIGKAWLPKQFLTFLEGSEFAYADQKSASTPRLIVLSAVSEDGIIQDSILVYAISKTQVSEDYHDNVNSAKFTEWLEALLQSTYMREQTGVIIVMDNAPYHSASNVPCLSARKQVLYDWLKENERDLTYPLPDVKSTRLWELKSYVRELKRKNNYFRIDSMVELYGHRILRLPPYNCDLNPIEFVWKDIKQEVMKKNIKKAPIATLVAAVKQALQSYNESYAKAHTDHVMHLRAKYWVEDGWTDEVPKTIAPILIPMYEADELDMDEEEDESVMPTLSPEIYDETAEIENEYDMPVIDYYGYAQDHEAEDAEAELAMRLTYNLFHGQNQYAPDDDCPRTPKSRRLNYND